LFWPSAFRLSVSVSSFEAPGMPERPSAFKSPLEEMWAPPEKFSIIARSKRRMSRMSQNLCSFSTCESYHRQPLIFRRLKVSSPLAFGTIGTLFCFTPMNTGAKANAGEVLSVKTCADCDYIGEAGKLPKNIHTAATMVPKRPANQIAITDRRLFISILKNPGWSMSICAPPRKTIQ
jgi:hypothetical protein